MQNDPGFSPCGRENSPFRPATHFVTPAGKVWGRPVGVTMAHDESLFITNDGSRSIWHVSYAGK